MNAPAHAPVRHWIGKVLLLAAAYYVAARLALLLALPPGHATAIWPPAGIALGGLLLIGRRGWPGVFLGSFLVNLGTNLDAGALSPALSLGIAGGATLQAAVGAGLVRRLVGIPNRFDGEWQAAALLFLAGPVSCLVNASVGVLLLWWAGRLAASECAFTWWTWWVGDSIGAFLMTPLVLLWADRSRLDWPARPATVTVPSAVMAALFVALFLYVSGRDRERIRLAFEFQSDAMTRAVENRLEAVTEALHGLQSSQGSRPVMERRRFANVTRGLLARRPLVQTLSWNPRVAHRDRAAFERAGRGEGGPPLPILEGVGTGRLTPAARRDEYFPAVQIESNAAAEVLLGFDAASEADRLEALRRARDTGAPAATPPLRPVQDPGHEPSILVFLPIYRDGMTPDTTEGRRAGLIGIVGASLRIERLKGLAMNDSRSEGIAFALRDATSPGPPGPDPGEGPGARAGFPPRTKTVEFAGRRWELRYELTPEYLVAHRSMQAWSVLAGGMLFTGLIGAVLLVVTGNTARIADRVKERTAELDHANAELVKEVAERRRAEEERDRFFQLSIDLFCIAGFDGYFRRVNGSFTRALGYTPDELLGRPFFDFVHPDDLLSTRAEVEKMAGGGLTIDFENRYRGKDGTYTWLQWNATGFADQREIYAVARDINERKRAERQMREFNETLERRVAERTAALEEQSQELRGLIEALSRSNQELDDFAYIASHDLKEPLRGISNYAAFLIEDYSAKLDDAGRAKLETLQRLSCRMTDLLDILLQYSRLGRSDLAVGPADLDAIVGEVLDSLQFMIEERGVTIERPAPLPVVRCDRARIGEVFRNLITNAIKYNDKQRRRVEIGVRLPKQPDSPIIFHVRDNGIGIREKHLESVFRIFKRLHGRDQFGGGTGAGLTIAKKIVERHGGRIWIESAFGEGTTVFFTLHGETAT